MGLLVVLHIHAQQDPQYSQYTFNQMVINPAYAGSKEALSGVVDMRQQWSGFDGAPQTQSFSFHGPVFKKRIGLGLSGYNDAIGPKRITAAYANVSYMLPISNALKLSFGIRGGVANYVFDFSKMNYRDPGEINAFANMDANKMKADFDAGIYLKSNSFYAGFSATHLNAAYIYKDKISFQSLSGDQVEYDLTYKLSTHLFGILSKGFSVGENLVINPTIIYKGVSEIHSIDANLNFLIHQRLWLGAFYKSNTHLGALIQVYVTNGLKIGYAFDTGVGSVQRTLGSGHEIMLGFDFNPFKTKMLSPRYL